MQAFPDPFDLKISHIGSLKPILKADDMRAAVLGEARRIYEARLAGEGDGPANAPEMIRALVAAAGMTAKMREKARPPKAPKKTGSEAVVVHSAAGAPLLRVDAKDRRGVTLTLFHKGGGSRAEAEGAKAVLIYGMGRTYFAGADIREFGKPLQDPGLPDLCNRIEASPLLVVSAIHGTALGGGLETALATHYRVALPSAKVGLPEVHLGILPGAGGTQRLPRVAGIEAALDLITTGRHVGAAEALELGVVDKIADGDPREVGLAYVQELLDSGAPRRPVGEMPAPDSVDFDAVYQTVLAKGRGQLSPATAVRAIQAACEAESFEAGIKRERELFMELMNTDQRKGLIHAFFSERAVSKLPELEGVEPRALNAVGVIGGGTMGAGIATAALLSGLQVVMLLMVTSTTYP